MAQGGGRLIRARSEPIAMLRPLGRQDDQACAVGATLGGGSFLFCTWAASSRRLMSLEQQSSLRRGLGSGKA